MNPADETAIESVFRLVNREVWIVTAGHEQHRAGLVATWVLQASIDPESPLLVTGIAPNHFTAELIQRSRSFAAHLIPLHRIDLAERFGVGSSRTRDKFAGLEVRSEQTGSPILADALAWLDCRLVAEYDAGDRVYFWGEVVGGGPGSKPGAPLTERVLFSAAGPELLQRLSADRGADIVVQRPLRQKWRAAVEPPQQVGA
jgi:flavin reductase (DIM6/NTAB) family NADH-FMN oxidoreductase RutF